MTPEAQHQWQALHQLQDLQLVSRLPRLPLGHRRAMGDRDRQNNWHHAFPAHSRHGAEIRQGTLEILQQHEQQGRT